MAKNRHIGKRRVRTPFIPREEVLLPVANPIPGMDAEANRLLWTEIDAADEASAATDDALTSMGRQAAR